MKPFVRAAKRSVTPTPANLGCTSFEVRRISRLKTGLRPEKTSQGLHNLIRRIMLPRTTLQFAAGRWSCIRTLPFGIRKLSGGVPYKQVQAFLRGLRQGSIESKMPSTCAFVKVFAGSQATPPYVLQPHTSAQNLWILAPFRLSHIDYAQRRIEVGSPHCYLC